MERNLEGLVRSLAASGWSPRDFRINHMEHVAHAVLGEIMLPLRVPFARYWRTVARISSILQDEGIFHVIIKTRRNYDYSDTNVDVFVKDVDSFAVQEALRADAWVMPSRAVTLKQRLIEREKLKMPARDPGLVPAHLYMSVSWRYQREVDFLDDSMIEQMPLTAEAPGLAGEFEGLTIPVPTRPADMLLHCAEIVFENYRITLGEALYLAWLVQEVSEADQDRINRLASDRGARTAVRCAMSSIPTSGWREKGLSTADWPKNLTARELLASWGERFGVQFGRKRVASAFEEWLAYAAFGTMYRIKRAWFE